MQSMCFPKKDSYEGMTMPTRDEPWSDVEFSLGHTDAEIVEILRKRDDLTPLARDIISYWDKHGRISEKQRYCLDLEY